MKIEVFILGGQIIDQKRMKTWWRGRRERIEKGAVRKCEEENKEHRHLPLLVVQLPQGTAFLLSSRLDSAVKAAAVSSRASR